MKKIILFLALLFSLITLPSYSQQFWMQKGGGTSVDEGVDIASDAAGNTYATGYFTAIATFGTISLTANGISDIYLCKMDNMGVYQWAVKAGGSGSDRPTSMKTDAAGNSYITGYFYGTATFGSYTVTSAGLQDVFIAKYDNTGTCLWAQSCGGSNADIGNGLAIDASGNVIVTGEFKGTATFGTTTYTSMNGSVDIFTTKLDGNGNFLWTKKGSAILIDRGIDAVCDATGNIYVTGTFTDTITFDYITNCNMYNGIFLIKYNSSGVEQWMKFSGGGTYNVPTGIAIDQNGNPIVTGDLQGSITFYYCPGNTTMTTTFAYNIFVFKYDSNGNLVWSTANGSNNFVTSRNIVVDGTGTSYIIGNFRCRFNEYANQYGQGTFNSIGTTDIFLTKFNPTGSRVWARQLGGHDDDNGSGIALNPANEILTTGSFESDLIVPVRWSNLIGYNTYWSYSCTYYAYCNDNNYGNYARLSTVGNSDAFIMKAIDTMRQPYDFFIRTGNVCVRPFDSLCINGNLTSCPDTVEACQMAGLYAFNHTCYELAPNYTYLWSNGGVSSSTSVYASGWYSVTQTNPDGCDVQHDSVYVIIHPNPPEPTITDDDSININSYNPIPIVVCLPDTIILTGRNFGNLTYSWHDPNNFTIHDSICYATTTGNYTFTVVDTFGCMNSNTIHLEFDPPLDSIHPKLYCPQDTDHNDSLELCIGHCFDVGFLDSLTNQPVYYPFTTVTWHVTSTNVNSTSITSGGITYCPATSDWYHFTASLFRANVCDTSITTVSFSIYVQLDSLPNAAITGNPWLCPGDSNLLIASGNGVITWYNNYVGDSIYVSQPGGYSIVVTNAAGCSATAYIYLQDKPHPEVWMNPIYGVICPYDSVLLTCDGNGTFYWEGPNGPININANQIYINQPGAYYCYVTDTDGCSQLSNTVIATQYNTPYLRVIPDSVFCAGDSVELLVITTPGSDLNWLAPLSGNSMTLWVDSSGYYSCSVFACNITTIVHVQVTMIATVAQISYTGPTTFCGGDSITLYGNPNMYQYIWEPGSILSPNFTVYQSGTYVLITSDSLGCHASDSVTITVTPPYSNPYLHAVPDTFFCIGDSVTINVISDSLSIIQWQSPLSGNSFHQVVNNTGTYSCNVTYCNITTTDSITVTQLNPLAQITPSGPIPFCAGDSITLTETTNFNAYVWLPDSSTQQSIMVDTEGIYRLIIADFFGCHATDSIVVTTIANPPPILSDTSICTGTSITLHANGNQTIYWYDSQFATVPFDSGYTYTTPILTAQVTYYLLSYTGQCRSTRTPVVIDVHHCQCDAPNIFTPNRDGYNDYWQLKADGYKNYHLIIFNRWGMKIFESIQNNLVWDGYDYSGNLVPDGTYYYIFTANDYDDSPFTQHGFITLIR